MLSEPSNALREAAIPPPRAAEVRAGILAVRQNRARIGSALLRLPCPRQFTCHLWPSADTNRSGGRPLTAL